MIRSHRPADLAEPVYGDLERKRREKWVYRQNKKGNFGVTIHDAPEAAQRFSPLEYLEPCPDCGKFQWDLRPRTLRRFCAPCAGKQLPEEERKYCSKLRQLMRGRKSREG